MPGRGELGDAYDPAYDPTQAWTDRPAERVVAGSILGGKYRLISEIGRGGMGSVWRAEHLGWEAPVALKIMNRDITARPEAVARFEREVRLAAGLRSPHVVQVLDHGVDEATRTPFIAMELLEGESLARRLRREEALSPADTYRIFSEIVRALTRAHGAGIVHRDLKPDNVFLVRNEDETVTKILDFGVAKWTVPDLDESGLTRPGSVVGTPYYMSPEQLQGSREIDHRADLWALAVIACECLTGRRPFEAPDFAQLAVMLLGNVGRPLPSSLGRVPPGFDAWFLRATDPSIERRFTSVREMAQTLAPICGSAVGSWPSEPSPIADQSYTQLDPASISAVSNTASRLFFTPTLWSRPMVKLVGTTAVTTLVVTAAIAFWLFRAPGESQQASPQTTSPQTMSPQTMSPQTMSPQTMSPQTMSPQTTTFAAKPEQPARSGTASSRTSTPVAGVHVRPIQPSEHSTSVVAPVSVESSPQRVEPSARATESRDGDEPVTASPRRKKDERARPRKTPLRTPTRAQTDSIAGEAVVDKPAPVSPPPPPPPPPPSQTENSSLEDGRLIRTKL
jgi:serine/threonine-protein kinase